jgi:hypothetical protein
MNGTGSNGPRQAALTLHALPDEDQQWVFERLEPRLRQVLQPLLDELLELDIPRDRDLVQLALTALSPKAADSSARHKLATAPAEAVGALLKGEPAGLVARLLAAQPWPWADALRQGWDGALRQHVAQALRDLPPATSECRLNDWLIEDLAQRLDEGAHAADKDAARSRRDAGSL